MRRNRRRHQAGFVSSLAMVAMVSAGCSSGGSTPGAIVVPRGGFANYKAEPDTMRWFKAHLSVISALGDLPIIPTSQPNYSALSAACLSLGDSVATAKKLPAIPDAAAQTLWKDALTQLAAGVTNCSNGVGHMNSTLLNDASSDFTLGHNTLASLIFGPPSKSTK
jgi:hypothetical protein